MAEPQPGEFRVVCPHCDGEMRARAGWLGRDLSCPHCAAAVHVPRLAAAGDVIRGLKATRGATVRFNFACPRCRSLLASHSGMAGHTARCPTCDAQFAVPALHPRTGRPERAVLSEDDRQDPTPMHAYAASGHRAPRVVRRPDGEPMIECPRCHAHAPITADYCEACGVPYTAAGLPGLSTERAGHELGVAALIVGLIGVPASFLVLPGPVAILLAALSWGQRGTPTPGWQATAGMALGLVGTALAVVIYL